MLSTLPNRDSRALRSSRLPSGALSTVWTGTRGMVTFLSVGIGHQMPDAYDDASTGRHGSVRGWSASDLPRWRISGEPGRPCAHSDDWPRIAHQVRRGRPRTVHRPIPSAPLAVPTVGTPGERTAHGSPRVTHSVGHDKGHRCSTTSPTALRSPRPSPRITGGSLTTFTGFPARTTFHDANRVRHD
jgi:hypothetical protein